MERLLSDKRVAAFCAISRRKVWELHARAAMPVPLRIGRSVRWDMADIELWIQLRCPSRERFEAEKARRADG